MNNNKTTPANTQHKSKIGGQAVIEGIMMRGIDKASLAVRNSSGEIALETWSINGGNKFMQFIRKTPILRGVVNFVISLIDGYKCLMKSVEMAGLDDDVEAQSKFEKWLEKTFGDNLVKAVSVVASVLGAVVAILLFMFVPTMIVSLIGNIFDLGGYKTIVEGVIKILVFIGYLVLVSKMKEIQRVFQYHGAEHKTIFCYEAGLDLTVENVKKQSRFHPRCGTSFLIIVLVLSIIMFSVISWESVVIRVLLKIAMLPLVTGLSYELIKVAGKYDNLFTRIISYPGLLLQRLTTNEPDDSQMEVAIAALKPVIPEDKAADQW